MLVIEYSSNKLHSTAFLCTEMDPIIDFFSFQMNLCNVIFTFTLGYQILTMIIQDVFSLQISWLVSIWWSLVMVTKKEIMEENILIWLIFRLHYCTWLGSPEFISKWSKVWMLEVDKLPVTSCRHKLYSIVCSKESSGIYECTYKTWWNKGKFIPYLWYISEMWTACW